jgi:hypothetical protein
MRLHEELIKQGILHTETDVRSEAVLYFSRSYTNDDSIMPLVIQAIEQYGWDRAFTVASCVTGLPLSEATLPWVLAQLQHKDAKRLDPYGWPARWQTLNSLLSNADAELLGRHKQTILDVESLQDELVKIIAERIDLLTADGESCWQELERFSVASKDIENIGEVDLDHAYALIEAIAREKERYAEKVLTILSEKIEDLESNPKVWMETFAVRMAGEMRLEAAVPLIIAKLKERGEDAEWLTEQGESALVKIGGDGTISAVAAMFRQGDWHFRMVASGILQHVHSDLAVTTALELLPGEEDLTIRAFLAAGLASQLAFEAIDPLRQIVLDGTYDESYADLKQDVVLAATLMDVEFPKRDLWKAEVEKKRLELERKLLKEESERLQREKRRLVQHFDEDDQDEEYEEYEEEEPTKKRVGRNDPCPCGSGKKFKKCCLRKQDGTNLSD